MTDMLTPLTPLPKDLRKASSDLGRDEARFLVDLYYAMQDERMGLKNQARALDKSEEPNDTVAFFGNQFEVLEKQIRSALDAYSAADPLGQWARSQVGIGPVIAAGLLAHIDIEKAPTVGHIWRFAGLDPTMEWKKGQKRPFNAKLKVLCWKIGDSFVKLKGNENCFFGHIYASRKEYEVKRNEAVMWVNPSFVREDANGYYVIEPNNGDPMRVPVFMFETKDQRQYFTAGNSKVAYETLQKRNIKDPPTLAVYRSGKLPDGRIDMRARRYAAKLFLAAYHEAAYKIVLKQEPPKPYAIEHLGHTDQITFPNMPTL